MFLVRPAAVLISQFLLSYDDCGDDRFSPGISDRVSLNCHVDLNSLGWFIGKIAGPLRPGLMLEESAMWYCSYVVSAGVSG